jgi:hypothetical protein
MKKVRIWLQAFGNTPDSQDAEREVPEIVYDWLVDLAEELNSNNNGYSPTIEIEVDDE